MSKYSLAAAILACGICISVPTLASDTLYGTYESYPIAKLQIDGTEVETEVPAINLKGTTLVPVRVIAEHLQSKVTWNQEKQTVEISSVQQEAPVQQPTPPVRNNEYNKITDLVQKLQLALTRFDHVYDGILMNYQLQVLEPYHSESTKDIRELYDNRVPKLITDLHDLLTELEQIRTSYPKDLTLSYNDLQQAVLEFYDSVKNANYAMEYMQRYIDKKDQREVVEMFTQLNRSLKGKQKFELLLIQLDQQIQSNQR